MNLTAITLAALALAACASTPGTNPDGGIASYDAIKQAQAECAAKGGTLRLRTLGDPQSIDAYACKRN